MGRPVCRCVAPQLAPNDQNRNLRIPPVPVSQELPLLPPPRGPPKLPSSRALAMRHSAQRNSPAKYASCSSSLVGLFSTFLSPRQKALSSIGGACSPPSAAPAPERGQEFESQRGRACQLWRRDGDSSLDHSRPDPSDAQTCSRLHGTASGDGMHGAPLHAPFPPSPCSSAPPRSSPGWSPPPSSPFASASRLLRLRSAAASSPRPAASRLQDGHRAAQR